MEMNEPVAIRNGEAEGSSGGPPIGGSFIPEVEQVISQLERGTVVTKFFLRKRPERRTLSIRRETRQIIWQTKSSQTGRNSCEGSGTFKPLEVCCL